MKNIILTLFALLLSICSFATIDTIRGDSSVCMGTVTVLSDSTSGGRWSSGDTAIVTIDSLTGAMTGISAGTTIISYTVDTDYVTMTVRVDSLPYAGVILGYDIYLCPWGANLYDSIPNGVWGLTDTSIASIDSIGFLLPLHFGTILSDTVTYIVSNSCGSDTTFLPILVGNPCEGKVNAINDNQLAKIFPNPATTQLTITTSLPGISVSISNLVGQTLFQHQYSAQQATVDVADLPEGMYLIRINGTEVRKFVKE